MNVKNCSFITVYKTDSKVTYIKQQKIFCITSRGELCIIFTALDMIMCLIYFIMLRVHFALLYVLFAYCVLVVHHS